MGAATDQSVTTDKPVLEPSKIGQFVALDGCPQFHQYEFHEDYANTRRAERNWNEAFQPLSLLLAKEGNDFEDRVLTKLQNQGATIREHDQIETWEESQAALKAACDTVAGWPTDHPPLLLTQTRFGLSIEAWPVAGDADIVVLWPTSDGIRIRICDVKAAHEEKTYHQLQVACYTLLCRGFLETAAPDYSWTLEGGIIHRNTPLTDITPASLPRFSLSARENDIRRLLQPDGRFDELWAADPAEVRYQLAPKCYGCAYKEACFTESIETTNPALLGISQGEQATLEDHGITSIHDLAALAYPPTEPRPYEHDGLTSAQPDRYETILNEPGIGERLPRYIQQAQALLRRLDEGNMYAANSEFVVPWLQGSGDGSLPEDDPAFDDADLPIDRGSLIRTYLHVEWDHRRDRIVMLSAYITASNSPPRDGEPRTVSCLVPDIPDSNQAGDEIEQQVLENFFSDVFTEISAVAAEISHFPEAAFHFYLYSEGERDVLVSALKRYESPVIEAARDLFGLRGQIRETPVDQAMVSVVQSEIESRLALPVPNRGLLPVKRLFRPHEDFFAQSDWQYERPDGTMVDLRDAFHAKLFDFNVPYADEGDSISLYPSGSPDGYYPSRARQGSHIPLEYVWAALGKFTEDWVDAMQDDYESYESIAPFQWVDRDTQSRRIEPCDIQALGERLAQCLAHIERGIRYRNASIRKRPLDVTDLPSFSLGASSLPRAFREYLWLEFGAHRDDILRHLALPVEQRIRRGQSIPLVVTAARTTSDGRLIAEGQLLYDELFDDGDRVAAACRQKGSQGSTSGSWMVANPLDRQGNPQGSSKPHHLERGPPVTIESLDIDDRSITISAIPSYVFQDTEFRRRHRDWTTEQAEADADTVCFDELSIFILDPRTGDLTAQRAYDLLASANHNPVCSLLSDLAAGNQTAPTTDLFSTEALAPYLAWTKNDTTLQPNDHQRRFIEAVDEQIALLQGPPGTGKTRRALGLAVLGRVFAFSPDDRSLSGIVAGESNKAVDELVTAVGTVYEDFCQTAETLPDAIEDVRLVRLTGSEPDDPHPAVEYINYHEDHDALARLTHNLRASRATPSQESLSAFDTDAVGTPPPLLVFTTPSRLYGFMNRLDVTLDESVSPAEWVARGERFFDLLAVDEASMMRLPSLSVAGAFIRENAQLLVAGDQRQLPPVRQHDWEREDRRPITEQVPYLSTLDYFRALNGNPVADLEAEEADLAGTGSLPFYQLERTYRCHEDVTAFLQDHVYAQDGIHYQSDITRPLPGCEAPTLGIQSVLSPEAPFVLVLHDERASQQSNPTEAAISASLLDALAPETSAGVVTPHNAQRGLLTTIVDDAVEIDTVERYQGGERDAIIVSTTASDPDFLSSEQDFILNPNRLNVALSRMKQKLVIIASKSVFELIPPEVEKYERARLWKALYRHFDVVDTSPAWAGDLQEFLGTSSALPGQRETQRLEIYHGD